MGLRFFGGGGDEDAFARVLTFSATEAALASIRERVYDLVCAEAAAADRDASQEPTANEATIAFCIAHRR